MDEYAETTIAQRISMVSGVGQVSVWGTAKYAVRVQVDPDRLAAHAETASGSRPGPIWRTPSPQAVIRQAF
jgi:multidrug efflux pump subunit AcrB